MKGYAINSKIVHKHFVWFAIASIAISSLLAFGIVELMLYLKEVVGAKILVLGFVGLMGYLHLTSPKKRSIEWHRKVQERQWLRAQRKKHTVQRIANN